MIVKTLTNLVAEMLENMIWKLQLVRQIDYRISYAQTGEDIIVHDLMVYELKKESYTYLDIGANAPRFLSNTYYMYRKGMRGVLVEPNVKWCEKIKKVRKGDICLNCGVADKVGKLTYYIMESDKINSFSKSEVEEYIKLGYKMLGKKEVEVVTINSILEKYGNADFISIDVEGIDFDIIKSLDFTRFSPLIICMETQEHGGIKRDDFEEINEFLRKRGYIPYADTMLNTIYVEQKAYMESRKRKK